MGDENRLEKVEREIARLKKENLQQSYLINKLLKTQDKKINIFAVVICGGLMSLSLMVLSLDLKTEHGLKAFEKFSDNLFRIAAISITLGSGSYALYQKNKK